MSQYLLIPKHKFRFITIIVHSINNFRLVCHAISTHSILMVMVVAKPKKICLLRREITIAKVIINLGP